MLDLLFFKSFLCDMDMWNLYGSSVVIHGLLSAGSFSAFTCSSTSLTVISNYKSKGKNGFAVPETDQYTDATVTK